MSIRALIHLTARATIHLKRFGPIFLWCVMSIKRLIEAFATREIVPIELNSVVERIRELGVQEEIYYWNYDIDPTVLQGKIEHWDWPDNDGNKHGVIDIYYAAKLKIEWQRVVVCKELLHILDPGDNARVLIPRKK